MAAESFQASPTGWEGKDDDDVEDDEDEDEEEDEEDVCLTNSTPSAISASM
jgi:hypothetical protein